MTNLLLNAKYIDSKILCDRDILIPHHMSVYDDIEEYSFNFTYDKDSTCTDKEVSLINPFSFEQVKVDIDDLF